MVKVDNIQGRTFNISLNQKNLEKGWYLIVTDSGKEYLVRRNHSLSSKSWFGLYQTEYSLKDHILISNSNRTSGASLGLAIVIPPLVRSLTPFEWWLGSTNNKGDILQGVGNLLCLLGSLLLGLMILAVYRKNKLEFFLKQKNASLKYVGRVRASSPLVVPKKELVFYKYENKNFKNNRLFSSTCFGDTLSSVHLFYSAKTLIAGSDYFVCTLVL